MSQESLVARAFVLLVATLSLRGSLVTKCMFFIQWMTTSEMGFERRFACTTHAMLEGAAYHV